MGTLIAEGKTKRILYDRPLVDGSPCVLILNKEDITALDGRKHDVVPGKAEFSTRTTVNTFALLRACGIPVAFVEKTSPHSLRCRMLTMVKLEVVTRGLAWGSFLKRNPKLQQGTVLSPPVTEFFLKTTGRIWQTQRSGDYVIDLPCDDPLLILDKKDAYLHIPSVPFQKGMYFVRLAPSEVLPVEGTEVMLAHMEALNRAIYEILQYAWKLVGDLSEKTVIMPDMKIEYGFDHLGRLFVGDVIDAESCRILVDGKHASKQAYRDGQSLPEVKIALSLAASLSDRFPEVQEEVVAFAQSRYSFVSAKVPVVRNGL